MNYYYTIVSIDFLINVEGTINFEIEGEILGQASCSTNSSNLNCIFCSPLAFQGGVHPKIENTKNT